MDLEDYTQDELWTELGRRSRNFNDGKCDYCGRAAGLLPSCKYPQRHGLKFDDAMRVPDVAVPLVLDVAASLARESDTEDGLNTADRIDDLRDALTYDEDGQEL
jgi:hypothetical protein